MITSQPATPVCTRTPSADRDEQDHHRLDRRGQRGAHDLREHDREARRRRREEALDDLVVEVGDHRHPAPRRAEERVHDDDRGREERDVRAGAEAAEPRHVAEELPVEDEPDHRLHEQQHDPDRLAHQVARLAHGHEPGVAEHGHPAILRAEVAAGEVEVDVVERRPRDGDRRDADTRRRRAPRGSPAARARRSRRARRACAPRAPARWARRRSRARAARPRPRRSRARRARRRRAARASAPSACPRRSTFPCETIASRSASWSASSR